MTSEQPFPKTRPSTTANSAVVEIPPPTASAIACELRNLADALEKGGETKIPKANLWWHVSTKEELAALLKFLPHPLTQRVDNPQSAFPYLIVEREHPFVDVDVRGQQSRLCILVEPAKPAKYRYPAEEELTEEVA